MIFFPSFFFFVFLSGITFSKQNRTTVSWILGGLLIGRFWKFKQFFLGVSLPGGATRTRLFDWVRWSSYAQISFPKEIIKQEEHLIYGGSVQSLLDHTWHFQLAFFPTVPWSRRYENNPRFWKRIEVWLNAFSR